MLWRVDISMVPWDSRLLLCFWRKSICLGRQSSLKLLEKFSAGHELPGLAARLDADFAVPAALEPRIERVGSVLGRSRAYIVKRLINLRRAQEHIGSLQTLASKLPADGSMSPGLASDFATFGRRYEKDDEVVMQQVENCRKAQADNGERIGTLSNLASKLPADGSMSPGLASDFATFGRRYEKDDEVVMQQVENCRRAQANLREYGGPLSTLASQMYDGQYQTVAFVRAVAGLAKCFEKDVDEVMQDAANLVYGWLQRTKAGDDTVDTAKDYPKVDVVLSLIEQQRAREAAAERRNRVGQWTDDEHGLFLQGLSSVWGGKLGANCITRQVTHAGAGA